MRFSSLFIISSLLFIVLLNSVYASSIIEVASPRSGDVYNIGDSVAITGQITLDANVAGADVSFAAMSKRSNKTMPISTKPYSFTANVPVTFSQITKGTLTWQVPSSAVPSGDWTIYITVTKNGELLGNITSVKFTVSRSLLITISSSTRFLNLGETIEAKGSVLSATGTPILGTAAVILENDVAGEVLVDNISIADGFIDFTYPLKPSDPSGNYSLTFQVSDQYGNAGLRYIPGMVISDKLTVNCTIPSQQFASGDSFNAIGNVQDIHKNPAGNAKVTGYLTFPSKEISLSFDSTSDGNGNFAVKIELPRLAEPGTYSLGIIAEDSKGNSGACYKTFAIPTQQDILVGLNLNSSWYYKTTEAGLGLNIRNKGNTELAGTATILIDDKETGEFGFSVRRGEDRTFAHTLTVASNPGEHTISILLISEDGKILTQTIPQSFTVYPHPGKTAAPNPKKLAFIVIGAAFVASFLYIRRKEIRDYLWHWEMQRNYGIGRKRIMPKEKKKENEE